MMEGRGPEPGPVRSSRYVLAAAKCATDLPDALIFRNRVNPLTQKYFAFLEMKFSFYASSRPARRPDGKAVWSWRPALFLEHQK
jgi:hypothetical protein